MVLDAASMFLDVGLRQLCIATLVRCIQPCTATRCIEIGMLFSSARLLDASTGQRRHFCPCLLCDRAPAAHEMHWAVLWHKVLPSSHLSTPDFVFQILSSTACLRWRCRLARQSSLRIASDVRSARQWNVAWRSTRCSSCRLIFPQCPAPVESSGRTSRSG